MMSDEKARQRREAAAVLRQIAENTRDEQLRAEIEACVDQIEAAAAELERPVPALLN
jgi:hypothetical protein